MHLVLLVNFPYPNPRLDLVEEAISRLFDQQNIGWCESFMHASYSSTEGKIVSAISYSHRPSGFFVHGLTNDDILVLALETREFIKSIHNINLGYNELKTSSKRLYALCEYFRTGKRQVDQSVNVRSPFYMLEMNETLAAYKNQAEALYIAERAALLQHVELVYERDD